MGVFDVFKKSVTPNPNWIDDVRQNGAMGVAVVMSNPQEILQSVGGYQGRDSWIDVQAQIEPADGPAFEAMMKCQLSQATFGMLASGMRVNIKYDPNDKSHVVLIDDANTLLSYRVQKD